MILVTGGAGFIGANFVLDWLSNSAEPIVNLDKLTYAGNVQNLASLKGDPRHVFVRGDICDRALVDKLLGEHKPRAIVHFAAESHVDRSIDGPAEFMRTNIEGTFCLLDASRAYWTALSEPARTAFCFLHVSTDEVYGSLAPEDPAFTETSLYEPNSPYSASKAASDHIVRAYHHTYGLPTLTTNCSNNYGPYQFPEKLIPLVIANALAGKAIPIYGDGMHVRDWLYVADHCDALRTVLARGTPGAKYNIGGNSEKANLEVVKTICAILDELRPRASNGSYSSLLAFVRDRAGHDRRYAIDAGKLAREVGWRPGTTLSDGLRKTVRWYLEHQPWVANVQSGAYMEWIKKHYGSELSDEVKFS